MSKFNLTIKELIWELEYKAQIAGDEEILKKAQELKIILFYREHGAILKGEK